MNNGRPEELRKRTRTFAITVIRLYSSLPKTTLAQVLGRQLLRSGTSVGAHYREACRARSTADFISKIEGGLQELDETQYWLELLTDSAQASPRNLQSLLEETDELIAIFVTVAKKAKARSFQSHD